MCKINELGDQLVHLYVSYLNGEFVMRILVVAQITDLIHMDG